MGLDFIRRAAAGFTKAWRRGKTDLSQPTLFTRYPETRSRTVIADLDAGANIEVGAHIPVCAKGGKLILLSGVRQIGVVEQPPADLLVAIHDVGDCVLGHIARINPLSRTADVEIE